MRNTDDIILKCFDDKRYANIAYKLKEDYSNNSPYPHVVIDNFLPTEVASVLANEYPVLSVMKEKWKHHENDNVDRLFLDDTTCYSHNLRLFASALSSRSFLLFLETITGIQALLPDPYNIGGGAMVTGRDGFLNIHVDFNWHQKLQAWRRCNALFYLTPDWNDQWGGDLELWSTDGAEKVSSITPKFNRVVIFSTTRESYHGQPTPLKCPEGTFRRVYSSFYYSSRRNATIDEDPHFTRYNNNNNDLKALKETSPYSEAISSEYLRNIE